MEYKQALLYFKAHETTWFLDRGHFILIFHQTVQYLQGLKTVRKHKYSNKTAHSAVGQATRNSHSASELGVRNNFYYKIINNGCPKTTCTQCASQTTKQLARSYTKALLF